MIVTKRKSACMHIGGDVRFVGARIDNSASRARDLMARHAWRLVSRKQIPRQAFVVLDAAETSPETPTIS